MCKLDFKLTKFKEKKVGKYLCPIKPVLPNANKVVRHTKNRYMGRVQNEDKNYALHT